MTIFIIVEELLAEHPDEEAAFRVWETKLR